MAAEEAPAVYELGMRVLFDDDPNVTPEVQRARTVVRLEHPARTDPGGAWVAERAGDVAGVALAIVRERLWGLSLLMVDEDLQGRGVGRELLGRALAYGEARGADAGLILSSERPAAMRSYAAAGFELHPTLAAAGVPDLRRAPDEAGRVTDAGAAGIALADELGRELRGATYGPDLENMLASGSRLLTFEDRAFALAREGHVQMLGARDERAAALVLWGALVTAPPGCTAIAMFLSAAQQWALRVALDARLALSPDGPLCVRGRPGPLAPWIPSGMYL